MILTLLATTALAVQSAPPELLAVWRKLDVNHRTCNSCHSPDGIELAAFGFPDDDITRRAAKHFPASDQQAIIRLLAYERQHYSGPRLAFMTARPMQPSGQALTGTSAGIRDAEFLKTLRSKLPTLTDAKINSLELAKKAKDELLKLDLNKTPVGFEMNRLSEDGFHGEEHATIANWFPDVPMSTPPPVISAENDYLAKTSLANLRKLDSAVLAANQPTTALQAIALDKYRSLLVLQHRLRHGEGSSGPIILGRGMDSNPMWMIGDAARLYTIENASTLGIPADVQAAKAKDYVAQLQSMVIPWLWLGWLEDPSLSQTGFQPATRTGFYMARALVNDGYDAHSLLFVARRFAELGYRPGEWHFGIPRHPEIQFSALEIDGMLGQFRSDPELHRFLSNVIAMMVYLVQDDVKRTKESIRPEAQTTQMRYLRAFTTVPPAVIDDMIQRLDDGEGVG